MEIYLRISNFMEACTAIPGGEDDQLLYNMKKFREEWAVNECVRAEGKNGNVKCQRSWVKNNRQVEKNIHQHQPTAKHMRDSETDKGRKVQRVRDSEKKGRKVGKLTRIRN